ncbi:MAG: hypothetical protein LBQ22_05030 [Bacteroidales bacterium]|jgi:hypothetical protein|nr:hypothetical protein [Bacteroidales bacterium]
MKKKIYILLLTVLWLYGCNSVPQEPHYIPEYIHLRNGDLAFRKGRSAESYAVTTMDSEAIYSHVGIITKSGEDWFVVHAVPGESAKNAMDTIKMDSIHIFFRLDRAQAGGIYRLKCTDSIAEIASENSLKYFEKKPLFDDYFNLDDTTALYCTELIYHVYLPVGIDVTEGRRHSVPGMPFPIIWPSDILKNENLIEIYRY